MSQFRHYTSPMCHCLLKEHEMGKLFLQIHSPHRIEAHVRHATKSCNFTVQLCCSTELPRQLSTFHRQTNIASSDTDDDISSALIIATTCYQGVW